MSTSAQTLVLLLVAITAAWVALSIVVLRRARHRRHEVVVLRARPRHRERRTEETGTFVPLQPVGRVEEEDLEPEFEPEAEFEPEPEPEPDVEPAGFAPHPGELSDAGTYEIVWYRQDDRIAFALQPMDGRAASWARYRSAPFAWEEDCDPPVSVRAAQRAHGRLRARLERDGWRSAGRGDSWFNHRLHPPDEAPEPGPQDDADA